MAGIFLNLVLAFVPLGIMEGIKKPRPSPNAISVTLVAGGRNNTNKGSDPLTGGNVPHVAVWDIAGQRIGQWNPHHDQKMGEDSIGPDIIIDPKTKKNSNVDPYYILLSNSGTDAVCLASITIASAAVSTSFYGDTGYKCGQSWYLSGKPVGSNYETPRCVWLDGDGTNKINANAISFHISDFAPSTDMITQYNDNQDTLCKSTPRFSFWSHLDPDSEIPIFDPPLEYVPDSSTGGPGADKDPSRVIDKTPFDKSVKTYKGQASYKRSLKSSRHRARAQSSNPDPTHLIITNHPGHDIRDVCEHPNSVGWDVVSTVDNIYCDMETRQLYPVCVAGTRDACFDMTTKTIRAPAGKRDISVSNKQYATSDEWGPYGVN